MARIEELLAQAQAGDIAACEALGTAYFKGTDTPKDLAKALSYYEKAAQGGSGLGNYQLGRAHETGTGAAMDRTAAHAYYTKAAQAGYQNAVNKLANWVDDNAVSEPKVCVASSNAFRPTTAPVDLSQIQAARPLMSNKKRGVAAALAFFLGFFGVHNFYLGYKKKALIQLIFCWAVVPYLWALGECVMLLTGIIQKDGEGRIMR